MGMLANYEVLCFPLSSKNKCLAILAPLRELILFFIIMTFIGVQVIHAQSKNITFETPADIQWAGVDRPGDLFLILKTGEVLKYDKTGKKIGTHTFKASPTLYEPLDGIQSFYFISDGNQYGNVSADMTEVSQHQLDPSFAISPWLVCPSLHELWMMDSSDFSIKKTKLKSTSISLESIVIHLPSKNIKDYIYMREYQNYLFLLDKNAGIHVYSGLGKFIKTIGQKDLAYFNFLGEEIYFMRGTQLVFIDLFNDETRTLTLPGTCKFALLNDDKLYSVELNKVTISDFKPY
ncbi:hypothetical protein BH09BAC3_BH09BAC3_08780 [soil metagenome]